MQTVENKNIISRLFEWMDASTCNFLAVDTVVGVLETHGFRRLHESDLWNVVPGDKCYVVKNGSAVFAFVVGMDPLEKSGFKIISAHTDSPCFKLKPNCEIYGDGGVMSLNVEKYGGGIMYTWFDRPLSISGRVMIKGKDAISPVCINIDLRKAVATIPHLAIHFNRAVNDGNKLSVQKDMKPVIGYFPAAEIERYRKEGGFVKEIVARHIASSVSGRENLKPEDILDYELSLYPLEKAHTVGVNDEYFQCGRIDDLSMAFAGLEAFVAECDKPVASTRVLALFDNEETGSGTKQGAASPVLRNIFSRICSITSSNQQAFMMALAHSFMISADDAHGWHPNYNDKYDPTNHPVLGGGPVVKINANCKYMTDARGAAVFHALCDEAGVRMQYFVNHSDVAGGSTLGNISSSQIDIDGVDVGAAIWAMHSAAETAAVSDHLDMVAVFRRFYSL